jgi:hypothetical protein
MLPSIDLAAIARGKFDFHAALLGDPFVAGIPLAIFSITLSVSISVRVPVCTS